MGWKRGLADRGGWGTAFLLRVCFLGTFVTWAAYTDHYDGFESIPVLSIIFFGAALFYWLGLIIFPLGLLICRAFVLLTARVIRLRHCPAPPACHARGTKIRNSCGGLAAIYRGRSHMLRRCWHEVDAGNTDRNGEV